jgi:hypothetical protein
LAPRCAKGERPDVVFPPLHRNPGVRVAIEVAGVQVGQHDLVSRDAQLSE